MTEYQADALSKPFDSPAELAWNRSSSEEVATI